MPVKVPFHKLHELTTEIETTSNALLNNKWNTESADVHLFFSNYFGHQRLFFTNSCSSALEVAVRALNLQPTDEVIVPAYTYVAVPNAVVNCAARPVFADVCDKSGNINPHAIENAITPNTKAVIVIHYAGNACAIEQIKALCNQYKLLLIEDAAQAIGTYIGKKPMGSWGHLATLSFDYMKNITCGQGGLLIVNDETLLNRIQVIMDNGTNRKKFIAGEDTRFEWQSAGYNVQINPLATYLLSPQLAMLGKITQQRLVAWNMYHQKLTPLCETKHIQLPPLTNKPSNGHIFFIITGSETERKNLRSFMQAKGVYAEPHYSMLVESLYGQKFATNSTGFIHAKKLADRLLRLPMWNGITEAEIETVCNSIYDFYK
jgi:dTDP-4-amino-4,6-dideoxygalactose transaminase